MAAVSDSSPLIFFGKIGRLDLIHAVFGEVFVPPAVWREVVINGVGKSSASEVANATWIQQRSLPNAWPQRPLPALHPGETETIILAASYEPPLAVILDDGPARRAAQQMGLVVVGCGGLLVLAKSQGHLRVVGPLLEALQSAGLFLSPSAVSRILARVGEQ